MDRFLKRLPNWRSIIGVYATAVFVIYGWTVLNSFWKVPSWMYFLNIWEILSVYAYTLVVAFAESVLVMLVLVIVGIVLPSQWWNDRFTSLGTVWLIVVEASVMLRLYTYRTPELWETFAHHQGWWWAYTFLIALVLSILVSYILPLQRGLELIADRLVVFLYLYMPLTAVSFLIVFLRNVL